MILLCILFNRDSSKGSISLENGLHVENVTHTFEVLFFSSFFVVVAIPKGFGYL